MAAPAGAPGSSENVSCCAGVSGSVAETTKLKTPSSLAERLPIGARTGGELLSLTITLKVAVAVLIGMPLSLTRMVKMFVVPPKDSSGVQVNSPAAVTDAFVGA